MNPLFRLFKEFAGIRGIMDSSFLVGGTVRDLLTGKAIHDYDIVIKSDAVNTARIFAYEISASFVIMDKEFGVVRVAKDGEFIDICAMRGESIEDDLSQRDFTINAMAINLGVFKDLTDTGAVILSHHVIDPFNGVKDLSLKVIRMVSKNNFVQDPLRLLRAYRFASTLDFFIHQDTFNAIRELSASISGVSAERIAEELRHILRVKFSYKTIIDMQKSGLLIGIFPELCHISNQLLHNAIQSCSYAEHILSNIPLYFSSHQTPVKVYFKESHRIICLKFAILLREGNLSEKAALRLKMSNKEIELISMITKQHTALMMLKGADKAKKIDFLIQSGNNIYPLLIFHITDEIISQPASQSTLFFCNELLEIYHSEILPKMKYLPILTGDDLIKEFNLKPSPLFSRLLGDVEKLFLQGALNSRDEALNAVTEMLGSEQEKYKN